MSCFTKLLILTVYVFYLQSVQVITTSDYSTSVYQVETSSFNNSLREDSSNGTTYISFPANTSVYVSPNYDILGELIADTNQTSVPIGLQITVGTYFNNFSDIPEIQTTGVPAMVTLMTGTKVAIFIDTRIWKHIQFVTSLVGFALNLLAFGVFVIHGKFFTKTLRILLSHQCFLDFSLCLMGGILLLQPSMWKIGWMPFDSTLCYTWHSQQLFWAFVFMSIQNLVVISYERYIAVCRATAEFKFQGRILKLTLLCVYISGAIMSYPMSIHNRWHNGLCHDEIYFSSDFMQTYFVFIYSCIWLYMAWVLPCIAFIVNYGRVVKRLIERNQSKVLARSEVVSIVQKRITKMAILLTLVVFFCIGFDAIAFINGNADFSKLKNEGYQYVGSPIQMTGLAFCLVNSVVNPIVYWIYMPKFRKATLRTLSRILPFLPNFSGFVDPEASGSVADGGTTTATKTTTVTRP